MKAHVPKASHPSFIEPLESRIAPAGVVAVDYDSATGVLTLTGDALDNSLHLFATGAKTHRIVGIGTDLNTGGNALDIGKLTKVNIIGNNGGDDFFLSDLTGLTGISFEGGAGSDALTLTNTKVKGNVVLNGGTGSDFVLFDGLHAMVSGNVAFTDPDGGEVLLTAKKTVIGGSFLGSTSGGFIEFNSSGSGSVAIGRGIEMDAGAGGARVELAHFGALTVGKLASGHSLLISDGAFANIARLANGNATFLGGIEMSGGTGDRTLLIESPNYDVKLGKLSSGHSVSIASAGEVTMDIGAANFIAAGALNAQAAAGSSLFHIKAHGKLTLGKDADGLSFRAGGSSGADSARIEAGNMALAGGVFFSGGDGQNDLAVAAPNGLVKIGKHNELQFSILHLGGTGNDTLRVTGAKITLAGGASLGGEGGTNFFHLAAPNGQVKVGKFGLGQSLQLSGHNGTNILMVEGGSIALAGGIFFAGAGSSSVIVTAGGALSVGTFHKGHSILYSGGSGADSLNIAARTANLTGGIEFTGGTGGNNVMGFSGSASVRIGTLEGGRSISFTGGEDEDAIYLGTTAMALKGSIEFEGHGGSDGIDLFSSSTTVGKSASGVSIAFDGGAGDDRINLNSSVALAGSLTFLGGSGEDLLSSIAHALIVKGPFRFEGGADADDFYVDAHSLQLHSSLFFDGAGGHDDAFVQANGFITGDVLIGLGDNASGQSTLTLTSRDFRVKGLALRGNLDLEATGLGGEEITLANVTIAKDVNGSFGSGATSVAIDSITVGGFVNLLTGGGADVVKIERDHHFGPSVFAKEVTIHTGADNDQVLIGSSLLPASGIFPDSTRARFLGGLTLDGGPGTDTRNDIAGENDFPGSAPTGLDTFEAVNP